MKVRNIDQSDLERARGLEYSRRYYKEHPEKCRAKVRRFRKRHPKLMLKRDRQYRRTHREEVNKTTKEFRDANRDKISEEQKIRRQEHPEKVRVYGRIQRHPRIYPLDSHCAFCGSVEALEHGHLDYEDDGHNYLTVCHRCNIWMEIGVD